MLYRKSNIIKKKKKKTIKAIKRETLTFHAYDIPITITNASRNESRNKSNRVLKFISGSVKSRSPKVILKLYMALVRPHLGYAVQFWSPHFRKDIALLESVQRRMTKKVQGMRDIPYVARLKNSICIPSARWRGNRRVSKPLCVNNSIGNHWKCYRAFATARCKPPCVNKAKALFTQGGFYRGGCRAFHAGIVHTRRFTPRHNCGGDLIKVSKWYKSFNKGDMVVLRISSGDRTRNNGFKLEKFRIRKEMGRNWLSNRVVDEWNGLCGHVVRGESMGSFKTRWDKFKEGDDRWNK